MIIQALVRRDCERRRNARQPLTNAAPGRPQLAKTYSSAPARRSFFPPIAFSELADARAFWDDLRNFHHWRRCFRQAEGQGE